MMVHVLHKHLHSTGITSSEMYEHKPAVICFDPMVCEYGVNKCLATFLFGGVEGKPQTLPGLTYLSQHNSALFNDNRKYENYLPIMMMACRSTWYAHLKDKMLERELVGMNGSNAGIYVFWLVAPKTTRNLYYSLTIYDRYYLNSRSVIRLVRDYASYQNPSDFIPMEQNYLLLRDSEVNELMLGPNPKDKQFRPGIPMEIIIYENPTETPVQRIGKKKLQEALEQLPDDYIRKYAPLSGDW
ncbi:GH23305 [Drosophila grimshawi]|uniref:GH23305 n=2 Tax=Drosophila grimshawi TaxID=7222 RepID=B4K007_DROGR|nr:GH23305 [Drosophila grimshawi]